MKQICILLIILLTSFNSFTQVNLDSLWKVWNDEENESSIRLNAGFLLVEEHYIHYDVEVLDSISQVLLDLAIASDHEKYTDYARYLKILYKYKNDPADYIQQLNNLLSANTKNDDSEFRAKIYRTLGDAHFLLSNYKQSLNNYQKSIEITETLKDPRGTAQSLTGIGWIYFRLKDLLKAREYYVESLELLENTTDSISMWHALNGLGGTYQQLMDFKTGLHYEEKCLNIAKRLGFDYGIGAAYNNIGGNYKLHGKNEQALKYFFKSLNHKSTERIRQSKAHTTIKVAETYQAMKNYAEAITWCREAITFLKLNGNKRMKRDVYACLFESYKSLGQYKEAVEAQEHWRDAIDQLQSEEAVGYLQQTEFTKQTLKDSLKVEEEKLKTQMIHQQVVQKKNQQRNILLSTGMFVLIIAGGLWSRLKYVRKAKAIIEKEKERSDNLLLNILPAEVAEELKLKGSSAARDFDQVSILFTDFREFTQMSEKLSAKDLVAEINHCFKAFDGICGKYGVEKIKTIGDSYMAAGGLPVPKEGSVKNPVLASLEMAAFIVNRKAQREAEDQIPFEMRTGIHTGNVVAGIVGVKKFQYDVWGDTVNTASRMESNGKVGQVNISQSTYEILKHDSEFVFESRGKIQAKGKGEVEMYFVRRA